MTVANSTEVLNTLLNRLKKGLFLAGTAVVLSACQLSPVEQGPFSQDQRAQGQDRGIGGTGAIAQNGNRGIGGTGVVAQDDSRGIGGTGAVAQQTNNSDDDRGIGGTGLVADNRGIGGTGIRTESAETQQWLAQLKAGEKVAVVGTINDFGSVWVNGLHIHFDEQTPVTADGLPISAMTLLPGQRAVITAVMKEGKLWAESIELIHEVIGPVSQHLPDGNGFTVLGQQIQLMDNGQTRSSTVSKTLPVIGQWVRVSGQRDAVNTIVASRVQNIDPQTQVLLRGQVISTDQDNHSIRIGRQRFILQNGNQINPSMEQRMVSNAFVVVKARLENNQVQINDIATVTGFSHRRDLSLISIERLGSTLGRPGPYVPDLQWFGLNVSGREVKSSKGQSTNKVIRGRIGQNRLLRVEQVVDKAAINWSARPIASDRIDNAGHQPDKNRGTDKHKDHYVSGGQPHSQTSHQQGSHTSHAEGFERMRDPVNSPEQFNTPEKQQGNQPDSPTPVSTSVPQAESIRGNKYKPSSVRPHIDHRPENISRPNRPERPAREFRRPVRPERPQAPVQRPPRP